jgi:hypothetical protein
VHAGRDAGRAGKRQTPMASETLNTAKTLKKLSASPASQDKPDRTTAPLKKRLFSIKEYKPLLDC